MENEIVRAFKLPALYHDDPRDIVRIAALLRWGGWIGLEETTAGGEAEALAKLAKTAEGCELRCEPALAEAGRASGWIAEEAASLEEMRGGAAYSVILGMGEERYSLPMVEKFVEIASDYYLRAPWKDRRLLGGCRMKARTRQMDPDEPRSNLPPEDFLALATPPMEGGAVVATFLRDKAPAFVAGISDTLAPPLVMEWLERHGMPIFLPIACRAGNRNEPQRALTVPEFVTMMGLMNLAAVGANWRGPGDTVVTLQINHVEVKAAWEGAKRAKNRAGRNDLCRCGSGKKYKKCHLLADDLEAAGDPRVASRATGAGMAEMIIATDGYDDCPICVAARAAQQNARERLN